MKKDGIKLEKHYQEESGKKIQLKRLEKYKEQIGQALDKQKAMQELEKYSLEIASVITDYNRKSCEETMMVKGIRKSCQETTNRKTHQENLANIALRIAKGINIKQNKEKQVGLSCGVIEIMARNHDIGHTFSGHSGEWWLSSIKEDYGIGYYCHNALGPRELIYTNQIYDEIIETIKQSYPEVGEKVLKRIRSNLWLIMEGINSHNGERSESEYRADSTKTEEDFERENLYCHTKKGFDKTVMPATPEASLMRLCDKISYIPFDMVDGLREGFITELDEEYRIVLRKLGITEEEIEEAKLSNHYEKIARKLQTIFIKDVIDNSRGDVIKMSNEISRLLHELRNINNRQIVNYTVLKEDNEVYPPALRKFMNTFGEIAIGENIVEQLKEDGEISVENRKALLKKYDGTPYQAFIQYVVNTNPKDFAYTLKIVEEATKQGIADEQEKARGIVREHGNAIISPDFKIRDERIRRYVKYYQNLDMSSYSEEDKGRDVENVMKNIRNPNKKSDVCIGMDARISLELGAKYLATLNDFEFMDLLRETETIDDTQFKSLTRKYKDIDLKKEVYIQPHWKEIQQEQQEALEIEQEEK